MKSLQSYIKKAKSNKARRRILLAEFIDDFRKHKDHKAIAMKAQGNNPTTMLFVATAHQLALELGIKVPPWMRKNVYLKKPYFVSDLEGLKNLALRDSPYPFKMRNIFVLGNFLSRC